ncbi:MAG TPA: DUF3566 domain-containing protein, partial [Pseudonocardiaceae bacterium]|nr:DUF3566 domain-containing protein [Pseudonocardiaceae bacterium]
MTSPEKPERLDAPTVQVARNSAETEGGADKAATGASENGAAAGPAAAPAENAAAPTVAVPTGALPTGAAPEMKTPEAKAPEVKAPEAGGPEVNAAPPPWQRVASDAQYAKEHDNGARPANDQPGRFEDWGYTRAQEDYSTVVTGTAAASAMPGAANAGGGGIGGGVGGGVNAGARLGPEPIGRTTVNLATPPPPNAPRPGASSTPPSALRRPGRGPRRASLQVKRVDPWSVLKLAFVLSVALFFVWLVAVGVLYGVLDGMGVWDKLNSDYNSFAQSSSAVGGATALITVQRVFGVAAIIGAINIVLFTALATV